jgi:hypothetical protein
MSNKAIEIQKFISGWDWNRVLQVWNNRIDDFSIQLDPLFTRIPVYDPEYPSGRENVLSWWPIENLPKYQIKLQRHLYRYPGTMGPCHPYDMLKGAMDTLEYLWLNKDDKSKITAVLISASLFSRLFSSRNHYPRDNWPPFHAVVELSKWSGEQWDSEYTWQHYHTDVLPSQNSDYSCHVSDMNGLIRYLAEEHAQVFLNFRPVSIEFVDTPDPFIKRIIDNENKLERQRRREFEERLKRETEERRQKEKLTSKWRNISKEELERLVWSKPTTELSKELGVSDVAISKRCKSLGISKPGPGFWAKVKAGIIENPEGKPIK